MAKRNSGFKVSLREVVTEKLYEIGVHNNKNQAWFTFIDHAGIQKAVMLSIVLGSSGTVYDGNDLEKIIA